MVKIKDGSSSTEQLDDDLQDNVYEAVLKQAYYMYRLFWGTFQESKDIGTLKMTLEIFYKAVSIEIYNKIIYYLRIFYFCCSI